MAEPTPQTRQPLGLFPERPAPRLYDRIVEDVACFDRKRKPTRHDRQFQFQSRTINCDPNNGDRSRRRSLDFQLWTF